jgi:glucosamine--fructose-6-phosphate aminotransferase (isomerizing)
MGHPPSLMAVETAESPAAVARLLDRNGRLFADIGRRLRGLEPPVILTCGRGSSDHAAAYAKYLCEIVLGVPVASLGPSVASIYGAPLKLGRAAMITISQSGASPDLIAMQRAAKEGGALTIALVNSAGSPVATEADIALPLHAGEEQSVAATKSFITSCVAAAAIVAAWSGDAGLDLAVQRMPQTLADAGLQRWEPAEVLANEPSLYVLGRGPALAIAAEAALKLKETASMHAEAFSPAEVMHGPLQLVAECFPVLCLAPDDQAAPTTRLALERLVSSGAKVFTASPLTMPGIRLGATGSGHGLLDPITLIQSFYGLAERISRLRGHDPDRPVRLRKITQTL